MRDVASDIDHIRRQIVSLKPRSKRRIQLETLARELRLKQLRSEIRASKRRAA